MLSPVEHAALDSAPGARLLSVCLSVFIKSGKDTEKRFEAQVKLRPGRQTPRAERVCLAPGWPATHTSRLGMNGTECVGGSGFISEWGPLWPEVSSVPGDENRSQTGSGKKDRVGCEARG